MTPRGQRMVANGVIAAIVVGTLLTLSIFFDGRLATAAEGLRPDAIRWGSFLSLIGQSGYMFAVAGLFLAVALFARSRTRVPLQVRTFTRQAERSAYILATLATSGIAAQVIKHIVGRVRPQGFREFGPYRFNLLSMKNAWASFPSGHTTTAFAMAVALSLLFPRFRVALFTLALAIGASRVVVHAHYLSDVAAGALLGTVSALLVGRAMARRGIAFDAPGPHDSHSIAGGVQP